MLADRDDRTRLALQELGVPDAGGTLLRILDHSVGLFVSEASITDPNNRTCAAYAWNLLCRTFRRLILLTDVGVHTSSVEQFHAHCLAEADSLGASVTIGESQGGPEWTLCVGGQEAKPHHIYISSLGWYAEVSAVPIEQSENSSLNPIGAMTAACLGVAAIFRALVESESPEVLRGKPLLPGKLNTFTYTDDCKLNPPLPTSIDIGQFTMVGCGAVAHFIVAALLEAGAKGDLELIDPDTIDATNLNRYVLARSEHLSTPKTEVLLRAIHGSALHGLGLPMTYQTFAHVFGGPRGTVVCTVDNDLARHDIQRDLPRLILEGATSQTVLAVGRYWFTEGACLSCRHPEPEDRFAVEEAVAARLRWSLERVLQYLESDLPLAEQDSRGIADALGLPGERWRQLVGQPLRVVWAAEVCGRLTTATEQPVETKFGAVSFASGLAGILVAGELIKERHFQEFARPGVFQMNALVGPTRHSVQTPTKAVRCASLCSDPWMQAAYRLRHGLER